MAKSDHYSRPFSPSSWGQHPVDGLLDGPEWAPAYKRHEDISSLDARRDRVSSQDIAQGGVRELRFNGWELPLQKQVDVVTCR